MTASGGRVLLVRTVRLSPEEASVLSAATRRLRREGTDVAEVLLGSASYEAEGSTEPSKTGEAVERWVLEEDARGRGLRLPGDGTVRVVSAETLVEAVMAAEAVVQLP